MITANGVDLSTLAYNVSTLTGRLRVPPRRGTNTPVPGRHGAIRTPGKHYGEGEVVLPMWLVGANTDGSLPAAGPRRQLVLDHADTLCRLFGADTVDLVNTRPDGSQRRLLGEVADVLDFTTMAGATRAEVAVTLRVPGAFWADTADVTASFAGAGTWQPAEFAGATAPCDELAVTFTGGTNPRVTSGGVWVQYSAVLASTESVTLDCATWSLSGGGGLVPDHSRVEHSGDARWFVLAPGKGASDVPEALVSQTGTGAMTTGLVGRRKYLVA